ncbi:hypothetical protein GCM10010995_23050 [Cysteiniphilum litorale]|uniref:Uncharacterized protein n=2 Tax=Cysteiniphilum litorale TaxID=2056700 RepID=A0A8J3E966_9GAMM|nr:hypothetical protein [Cysteiniphilum sp. SYW-8]GGG04987.1 hypothetical protein GCM10010995_23050 [Cysteiniphilum litorale]
MMTGECKKAESDEVIELSEVRPEKIFNSRDLGRYYICRRFYPQFMQFFGFDADIQCVIEDEEDKKDKKDKNDNKESKAAKIVEDDNDINPMDAMQTYGTLNYFYTEVQGYEFSVKLFSSLSLDEFFGKLVLLNEVRRYIKKHHCNVSEAIINLLADHGAFCVIEQDINEMIALKYSEEIADLDNDMWGDSRTVH